MEVLQFLEFKLQVKPGRSFGREKRAWREPGERLIEAVDVDWNNRTAGQICTSRHAAIPASGEVAHHQDAHGAVFAPAEGVPNARLVEAKFETHTSRHGVSPWLRPDFIVGRFDGRPAQRIEWPDAILCEESA
jgi:hypothetical protein